MNILLLKMTKCLDLRPPDEDFVATDFAQNTFRLFSPS